MEKVELLSPAKRRGISGSTLKLIAIFTMIIDHTAAALIEQGILYPLLAANGALPASALNWYRLDMFCRYGFGRIGFPIFCFLMVEGFFNTHDRKKYALRLGLFCLLSEIPFDMALFGTCFTWRYQNVFFTLLIGFCTLWGMEILRSKENWQPWLRWTTRLCVLGAGMALAALLHTDYGAFGVAFIALFYLLHTGAEWKRNLACGVACAWEYTAPLALIPIHFYNGTRGLRLKYVFYLFYPVHLLLLALIAQLVFGL